MEPNQENSPEHYRQRAEQMREQAGRAHTEELRLAYLALAADWARLAEQGRTGKPS